MDPRILQGAKNNVNMNTTNLLSKAHYAAPSTGTSPYNKDTLIFTIEAKQGRIFDLWNCGLVIEASATTADNANVIASLLPFPAAQWIQSCELFINDSADPIESYQTNFPTINSMYMYTNYSEEQLKEDEESLFTPLFYDNNYYNAPTTEPNISTNTTLSLLHKSRRDMFLLSGNGAAISGTGIRINKFIPLRHIFRFFASRIASPKITDIRIFVTFKEAKQCLLQASTTNYTCNLNSVQLYTKYINMPVNDGFNELMKAPFNQAIYSSAIYRINDTGLSSTLLINNQKNVVAVAFAYTINDFSNRLIGDVDFCDLKGINSYNIFYADISIYSSNIETNYSTTQLCRVVPYNELKHAAKFLRIDDGEKCAITYSQGYNYLYRSTDNVNENQPNALIYLANIYGLSQDIHNYSDRDYSVKIQTQSSNSNTNQVNVVIYYSRIISIDENNVVSIKR